MLPKLQFFFEGRARWPGNTPVIRLEFSTEI
jgi:hypothetical protein